MQQVKLGLVGFIKNKYNKYNRGFFQYRANIKTLVFFFLCLQHFSNGARETSFGADVKSRQRKCLMGQSGDLICVKAATPPHWELYHLN